MRFLIALLALGGGAVGNAQRIPQTIYQKATDVKRNLADAGDLVTVLQAADEWDTAFRDHIRKHKIEDQFEDRDAITEYFVDAVKEKALDKLMEKLAPELAKAMAKLATKTPHLVSLAWAVLEESAPAEVRNTVGELLDLDRGIQGRIRAKLKLFMPPAALSIMSSISHDFAKDRASLSALPLRTPKANVRRPSRGGITHGATDVDCSILQDPGRSEALLEADPDAWKRLVEACDGKNSPKPALP